jgi:hypothetical protein
MSILHRGSTQPHVQNSRLTPHMWWQDLRYGFRMLRKDALTTATALVVLALGIGGTTTVFTLVNALLLRPLPYAEPDRLVAIDEFAPARTPGNDGLLRIAFANYVDLRARARTVEDIALFDDVQPVLRDEFGAERVEASPTCGYRSVTPSRRRRVRITNTRRSRGCVPVSRRRRRNAN